MRFHERDDSFGLLQNELKSAQHRIASLEENIDLMKHKEEEALLSLAENKLHVHQELEAKELQIKSLEKKIAELNDEMKKLKTGRYRRCRYQ